jgi:hypothetical protein
MILIEEQAEAQSRFGVCAYASANSTEKKSAPMPATGKAENV